MLLIAKFKEIWSLDSLLTLVKLRLVCHSSKIMQGAEKVKSAAGQWATLQSLSVDVNAMDVDPVFVSVLETLQEVLIRVAAEFLKSASSFGISLMEQKHLDFTAVMCLQQILFTK